MLSKEIVYQHDGRGPPNMSL